MSKQKVRKLRLSASRCNTYARCPKKYYWTYVQHLQPKDAGTYPLRLGVLVHRLLHQQNIGKINLEALGEYDRVVKKLFPEILSDQEAVSLAKDAVSLFSGYVKEYADDPIEVVSSEIHLELDRGPYILYARVDQLGRTKDKKLWRVEHKTAARVDNAYLRGLKRGIQAGIADILLGEVITEKVYGTIYNLLVKTKIPAYYRSPVLTEKNLRGMTESMLCHTYTGVNEERFGCSMNCFTYNRECEYLTLCKYDSPQIRESFFKERPDVIPTSEGEEDEV